jgi:polar amino acid transport system substrate-binding protein
VSQVRTGRSRVSWSRVSWAAWLGAALVLAVVGGACSGPAAPGARTASSPRIAASTPTPAPATAAAPPASCGDATASLRPATGALPAPGSMPAGTLMKTIQDRGKLVAGVSQDILLFGYQNPISNQLEGFDIDMVKQVSKAIFGDENHVEYRAITAAQRIPLLQDNSLDIVALTMTINCDRWKQIDFSSVYYDAGQRVLVSKSSGFQSLQDLGGKKVCAAAGTTSIDNVKAAASHPVPVSVPEFTDCLVLLQEGQVDAISTDDTVLLGLAAQDPTLQVVGPKFTDEPYGLGVNQGHPEFVRFVNAVLEKMRSDGTWATIYNRWLGKAGGGSTPPPPPAKYKD